MKFINKPFLFQRKILVIDKKIQWMLAAYGVFLIVSSSIFTATVISLLSLRSQTEFGVPFLLLGFMGVILFTLSILWGLILSNQICGPIYRVHREIKSALSGNETKPIKLRKNDQFQQFISDFNEVSQRWNAK